MPPLTDEDINAIQDPVAREEVRRLRDQDRERQAGTGPYAAPPKGEQPSEEDKPVELRRGTSSPTGTYMIGNLEVPLSEPGALRTIDVRARMNEMVEKIRGALGDDDDVEALKIRDKLNSGNFDEQDLANFWCHLNQDSVREAREYYRHKREEQKAKAEEQKAKAEEEQKTKAESEAPKSEAPPSA